MKIIVVLASRSFIYYVINVYVPRVRANAYQALTTPPRVFRDPKMCLRNIWTAPYETLDNVESEKVPCPDVGEWVRQVPRL